MYPGSVDHYIMPSLNGSEEAEVESLRGQLAEDFEWYPVSKDVGSVRNKGEYLIKSAT